MTVEEKKQELIDFYVDNIKPIYVEMESKIKEIIKRDVSLESDVVIVLDSGYGRIVPEGFDVRLSYRDEKEFSNTIDVELDYSETDEIFNKKTSEEFTHKIESVRVSSNIRYRSSVLNREQLKIASYILNDQTELDEVIKDFNEKLLTLRVEYNAKRKEVEGFVSK